MSQARPDYLTITDPAAAARDHFQTLPIDVLRALTAGDLDGAELAARELADRGRDVHSGAWIGFKEAAARRADWLTRRRADGIGSRPSRRPPPRPHWTERDA